MSTARRVPRWFPARNRTVDDPEQIETAGRLMREFQRPGHDALSDDEQERLHALALRGDEDARLKLFKSWRRFAYVVARHYAGYAPIEDLYQAAQIALWRSIESWRPGAGSNLGSWALLPMRSACRKIVAQYSAGWRVPADHDPSDLPTVLSLDSVPADSCVEIDGKSLEDDISQSEATRLILRAIRETCNPREADFLERWLGIGRPRPLPAAQIAQEEGVSRERLRQILYRALGKLRAGPHAETLRALWEEL